MNPSKEGTSHEDELKLWQFARKLLVRKWSGGWFTAWERAYYTNMEQHWWLTAENVNGLQNRTGAKLVTLLSRTDNDLLPALYASNSIKKDPLEEFIGMLLWAFKKGNASIYEYVKSIRRSNLPTSYPMSMGKPLLHLLCGQFLTEYQTNRYIIMDLLSKFFTLEWVDINMLDNNGCHVLDIFDTDEKMNDYKNQWLIELLIDKGALWECSTLWMIDDNGKIVPKVPESMSVVDSNLPELSLPWVSAAQNYRQMSTLDGWNHRHMGNTIDHRY